MDYLEGLLLGKLWSDTDFENRKHFGLFVLYGILTEAIVLLSYVTGRLYIGIGRFGTLQLVLLILLMVASPFICYRYYRMPLWGKILILLEKLFNSYLVLSYTVSRILPRITVGTDDVQTSVIDYLNSTLETYTAKYAGSSGSFSTVIGVLAGGLHVVGSVILAVVVLIALPGLIYLLYRIVQYCWDWLINVLIIKRFFPARR